MGCRSSANVVGNDFFRIKLLWWIGFIMKDKNYLRAGEIFKSILTFE
jgi:hypothetical protein